MINSDATPVANLAIEHKRLFNDIEGIDWPFLILFFLLAGGTRVNALAQAGLLVIAYTGLRIPGRIIGIRVGGRLWGMDETTSPWKGLSVLPLTRQVKVDDIQTNTGTKS